MTDGKRDLGPSVDGMAFDLLADAFLDVTGVLMRIDPEATRDLLRLIQERVVGSLDGSAGRRDGSAEAKHTSDLAAWKVGVAIRAAETVLGEKNSIQ